MRARTQRWVESDRSRSLLCGLVAGVAYFAAARAGTLFVADGISAVWFASGVLLAGPVLVLVVWAVVATALTARTFRWSD